MSLALQYWMGGAHHCSGPPVSEMTYTVSSGMLNSTIPYHTIPSGTSNSIHTVVRSQSMCQQNHVRGLIRTRRHSGSDLAVFVLKVGTSRVVRALRRQRHFRPAAVVVIVVSENKRNNKKNEQSNEFCDCIEHRVKHPCQRYASPYRV